MLTMSLISISAVSAQDVSSLNGTVEVNDEIRLETNGIDDSVSAVSTDNVVASDLDSQSNYANNIYVDYVNGNNSRDGSNWTNAVQTIEYAASKVNDGDSIYLAGVTHQVSNKITVNKTITIIGQDGTIITNNRNGDGLFNISAENVNIVNCTFVNSSSDKTGGVIYISGDNFTFSNSSFINNIAMDENECWGGAIYNAGNRFTVRNSSFINNSAFFGGAIYNVGNSSIICNSIFISNSATSGGAILNNGNINVFNSSFINNSAKYGGAISNPNGDHHANVSNSIFVNNTAKSEGEGDAIFNDGIFTANDNWWGNNTPNWNKLIKNADTVTHNSYVVLNLTSSGGVLYLNFYRNGTNINVNVSSRDVKLAIDDEVFITKLVNSTEFKYLIPFGVYNVTAVVDNQKLDIFNLNGPKMNVTVNNILHGENATIKINILANITGNVTVQVIGQNNTYTINKTLNGESVNVSGLSIGVYKVNVTYNGNDIYKKFTNNTSFEVYLPKVVYVDYINGRDDNNGSNWNDALKTIEYAVNNVINGSTIYLSGVVYEIDDLITVNKTIAIIGQNGSTITNKHNTKGVFKINASNVEITNCIFVNSSSDKRGGVIYNSGDNFTISGSSFINNTATDAHDGYGGAIYNTGNSFTVSNSSFINNSVVFGGAIYNEGNNFTVNNSSFIKNKADAGGAIINHGKNIGVFNSSFIKNNAEYGGAISNIHENNVNVSNSIFVNNTAKREGDAILNDGIFTANDNWWGNNTPNWNKLIKNNGNITHNSYVVLNLTLNDDVLYLNFYKNGTNSSINIPARDVKVTIGDEIIDGKIVNGAFKTNYTIPSDGYISTIVDNEKLVFAIIHVDYLKGNDENDGLMWSNAVKTIEQANKLVSNIGIIYLANGTHYINTQLTISKKITIIGQNGAIITNNCSGYTIFKIIPNGVKIDNCIFANNGGNHSSIIHNMGDNFVINNSKFINNSIVGDGAAILNDGGKYFIVINSTFINNTAKGGNFGGGAILNGGFNFKLLYSTFINNTVAADGGAIYNTEDNFTVVNSLFVGNVAGSRGGAILNTGVNFTVVGSSFDINIAKNDNGGAIRNLGANFTLSNSNFTNNSANYGGAIYNYKASNFTVIKSTFVNNSAKYGGAILNMGVNFTVVNSSFERNIVENAGGAIYNYNCSNFKIKFSSFVNNSAKTNAGAIFNDESNGFEIINSSFVSNVAKNDNGGAIRNTGNNFLVKNSTFQNNSADFGGAIIDFGANFTTENSSFEDNVAKYGGAIYTYQNANFTVFNSFFIKNKVNGDGGAIYVYQSTNFTITESSFVNNSASNIWNSGALNINNSTFEGNNSYMAVYNANKASLNLTNNKYHVKTYIYNNGTLTDAIITVLENKTVDTQYGKNILLYASVTDDGVNIAGNILYFIINGNKIKASSRENGTYFVNYNVDFSSKQIVSASYDGAYMNNTLVNTAIVDARNTSNINISVKNNVLGENVTIIVCLVDDATGNVTLTIDKNNYTANLINGVAKVNVVGLDVGSYDVTVTYSGDDKYKNSVTKYNMTVLDNKDINLNSSDITMFYKDGTRFVAVLTDYKGNPIGNQSLTFTINGQSYVRVTDVNGTASIAINLISNVYMASVYFNGTKDYNNASVNVYIDIKSTIKGSDIVKMYQNDTQFLGTFLDSDGKVLANTNVTFNINGVFYTRTTDVNGTIKLAINLRPGNYTLTAINPINGEQKGFNVLVKSLVETNDLTKYYMNDSKFEVKVLNKDGSLAINKEVTFNINGVFYTRASDEKGIVKLAINLRPGNYIITTTNDGLSIGNNVEVLPTLETSDLSMTYGDGSKFQAKTLDGQGNPLANQNVTFNVNGVFYQRISGSDGIANLNINLNRGEYIITSMWNDFQIGNKLVIS